LDERRLVDAELDAGKEVDATKWRRGGWVMLAGGRI
jgi:hypothetical protein